MLTLPIVARLPDDPEWDKGEKFFTQATIKNIHPPEFD
jgi:hypothetical protein